MSQPQKDASILTHFANVDDPRDERGKEHRLLDVIAIAICAVICGAESWVDIEQYAEAKQEWLRTFLPLWNGIPAHDTFARVFARLDPKQMQQCFLDWIEAISQLTAGEVVAIDGKTLRHCYDTSNGKAANHRVSAWASHNRLGLGQRKVDDKSNEITAIPELLQVLSIAGWIVTIDPMGTQKDIAATIIDQGSNYVLALKGNQSSLFESVQWLFEQAQITQFYEVTHEFVESIDQGHGRIEIRRCRRLSELDYLEQKPLWKGLQSIAMVECKRRVNGQESLETHYYISTLASNATKVAEAVRTHWSIENSLHWVLDVSFDEDTCRIRKAHAPQNMTLLRQIALNLLGQDKSSKIGIAAKRKKAGWDDAYLLKFLAQ